MQVTNRQFYNTAELKQMIAGFRMLFGVQPDVRIEVHGTNGGNSGTPELPTGEILFFPSSGFVLEKIGNKNVTVRLGSDDTAVVCPDDTRVTFHAAFYLP